jgi:expansin
MRVLGSSIVLAALAAACGGGGAGTGSTTNVPPSSETAESDGGGKAASTYSTDTKSGIATYYAADGSGNCSFDATPNDLDVVALNPTDYAESAACGSCMLVRGELGDVRVRVVDSCPGCDAGHLDLSEQAFAKIAEKKKGRVQITYQTVACDLTGSVSYHYKEGSSKYWTAIQVRNHRLPVAKVEYARGGAFVEMKRANYNYFIEAAGVGEQQSGLRVRVTAADGQTIEDTLPKILDNELATGASQFR